MPNQYYSPNGKITGGALFASFNSKEGSVYLKLLKQIANNPDKKGNFDGKNPINIKLGQDEAADMIRAVRVNGESKFFHQFKETKTTGNFKFYTCPAKDNLPARSGFGLSVKKTVGEVTTEIKVGFTLGSAERFSLFLQNALVHTFNAEYSQDLKNAKEFSKNKENTTSEPAQTSNAEDSPEF